MNMSAEFSTRKNFFPISIKPKASKRDLRLYLPKMDFSTYVL
jgi:hypothetical protein